MSKISLSLWSPGYRRGRGYKGGSLDPSASKDLSNMLLTCPTNPPSDQAVSGRRVGRKHVLSCSPDAGNSERAAPRASPPERAVSAYATKGTRFSPPRPQMPYKTVKSVTAASRVPHTRAGAEMLRLAQVWQRGRDARLKSILKSCRSSLPLPFPRGNTCVPGEQTYGDVFASRAAHLLVLRQPELWSV